MFLKFDLPDDKYSLRFCSPSKTELAHVAAVFHSLVSVADVF